jgi:hypothetical protein
MDPVVDQGGLDLHLVSDLGNGDFVDEVSSDDGSLVSSRERASFSGHGKSSSGENNSPTADFQFQERQHNSCDVKFLLVMPRRS